jgi:ribokinase
VVDTTGAGDAFAGALAATLVAGGTLASAVAAVISAGSAAVQHPGAQPKL